MVSALRSGTDLSGNGDCHIAQLARAVCAGEVGVQASLGGLG